MDLGPILSKFLNNIHCQMFRLVWFLETFSRYLNENLLHTRPKGYRSELVPNFMKLTFIDGGIDKKQIKGEFRS